MSAEKELAQAFSWTDQTLLSFVVMILMGAIARVFVSNEPLDLRKLAGEAMLAALGAVMLYSFGLLQGMSTPQLMFLGALGGLGGVRLLEWIMKIARKVKESI